MDREQTLLMLSERPELVHTFPDSLLSSKVIDELKNSHGVAIAEVAGRDSIAAVIVAVKQYPIKKVLPTIAFTGTEFGKWETTIEKSRLLAKKLRRHNVKVFDPLFLGSPKFWWLLAGRYISSLFHQFGFYTPCLGCHLYLHAIRIPLAKRVGAPYIISGERERHDGRVKLNQITAALNAYENFVQEFDVHLLFPLRYISSGEEIEKIIGQTWEEGREQLQCVLSKNYQDINGTISYNEGDVSKFFNEFAIPVAKKIIRDYLNGLRPDYEAFQQGSFPQIKLTKSAG